MIMIVHIEKAYSSDRSRLKMAAADVKKGHGVFVDDYSLATSCSVMAVFL